MTKKANTTCSTTSIKKQQGHLASPPISGTPNYARAGPMTKKHKKKSHQIDGHHPQHSNESSQSTTYECYGTEAGNYLRNT